MLRKLVLLLVFVSASASAGGWEVPDFKPLTPELQAFTDRLISAAKDESDEEIAALLHPELAQCDNWNSGMRDRVINIAKLLYGQVPEDAEMEFFTRDADKAASEAETAKLDYPVLPQVEVVIRSGTRTTAIRVARDNGEYYLVWNCI